MRLIAAALAAGLALAGSAWAQTTSATVTGVVRSRAGEPVTGAVVEAHAPDTGVTRRVTPVAGARASTSAPETGSPFAERTTPVTVAEVVCANPPRTPATNASAATSAVRARLPLKLQCP